MNVSKNEIKYEPLSSFPFNFHLRPYTAAFARWAGVTELMARQRLLLVRALRRISLRRLAAGFEGWLDNASEGRRQRSVMVGLTPG